MEGAERCTVQCSRSWLTGLSTYTFCTTMTRLTSEWLMSCIQRQTEGGSWGMKRARSMASKAAVTMGDESAPSVLSRCIMVVLVGSVWLLLLSSAESARSTESEKTTQDQRGLDLCTMPAVPLAT